MLTLFGARGESPFLASTVTPPHSKPELGQTPLGQSLGAEEREDLAAAYRHRSTKHHLHLEISGPPSRALSWAQI